MSGIRELGLNLESTALFIDYDGTLAPIVDDPALAVTSPGAKDALAELRDAGTTVTVVSGRPVGFLADQLGSIGVELIGLYGLETVIDGCVSVDAEARSWRTVVADVCDRANSELPSDVGVEDKGLSLTIHYRTRPDLDGLVARWARAEALRSGLVARSAKASVEMHPPVSVDKGSALLSRVDGDLSCVVYIGDDVGDAPAFDALDDLGRRGRRVLRVVVGGPEAPAELLERADVVLSDPEAVVDFLSG